MLDHIFLTVTDTDRSIVFYERLLPHLGIISRLDYDGNNGPAGHADLKGFGSNGRIYFWLRQGNAAPEGVHVGFTADSEAMVNTAFAEAIAAGATQIHPPGPQLHYDPRYYAAQVRDLDGYSLEFVYKSWQHRD
ncbi:VOC family protein [Methylophaga sp.]|jgi:catechol 2,3-dioxygenase-like lactoylglutathione lyase family enzyme|uniref:VOC family protein n=1 Tax=Methylophaga sp. TaxID=2024840 RepID=UPI001400B31B|nr:VOC family protein [Methylophaga sp.]MTI63307.1 VOC family protein [Methylophaga sp.]